MQIISGKLAHAIAASELAAWAAKYQATLLDLGTGDGRFVRHLAKRHPELAVIGVDLNAANLRRASRTAPSNALYVIADALALPEALNGSATRVTINFPWGSLLRSLLTGDQALVAGLRRVASGAATLDIRLNAGAVAEAGFTLDEGGQRLTVMLRQSGITIRGVRGLGPSDLRSWPTTWSKRLAFGRDSRAIQITAELASPDIVCRMASNQRRLSIPSPAPSGVMTAAGRGDGGQARLGDAPAAVA